jgi:hypothetical protein
MTRELAYRESGGVDVALFWDTDTSKLTVRVSDRWSGDSFSLAVEAMSALDAFYHPYAHASQRGVTFAEPVPRIGAHDETDGLVAEWS